MTIGEGEHAGQAAQRGIDFGRRFGDRRRIADQGEGPVEAFKKAGGFGRWPLGRPADDGNDPAHRRRGYGCSASTGTRTSTGADVDSVV